MFFYNDEWIDKLLTGVGLFIFGLIVIFIILLILFYLYNIFCLLSGFERKKITRKLLLGLGISAVIPSFYLAYTAVYPTDDFYYQEFTRVTGLPIPPSAHIKKKEASYPDIHGDYQVTAMIELSQQDYQQLLFQLQQNPALIPSSNNNNTEKRFDKITKDEADMFYIQFLQDNKTIIIYTSTS